MTTEDMTPPEKIDAYIEKHDDWRGRGVAAVRRAMLAADDAGVEQFKWMGSPVWECDGLIGVCNDHKDKVKLTFAHGAKFDDPDGLFNGKDTGNTRRSIDWFRDDVIDEKALTALIRTAIAYNRQNLKKNAKKT